MSGSSRDILESFAGGFIELLSKIRKELDIIEKESTPEELDDYVNKSLDQLLRKYYTELTKSGNLEDVKRKVKEKYSEHLRGKRVECLQDAKNKLLALRSEVLSVAPPSVYRCLGCTRSSL
jgi:hypothetical protein